MDDGDDDVDDVDVVDDVGKVVGGGYNRYGHLASRCV